MQNFRKIEELRRDGVIPFSGTREGYDLRDAGAGSLHFYCAFLCGGRRCQAVLLRLCSLMAVVAGLMTFGCGTTHATLDITAPSTTTPGTPFTVTVTAMYGGKRDTIINSVVQFSSSDSAAILPGYYQFTAADAGSHTWPNGFILTTPGNQTITATMVMETGITATVNVNVSASTVANRQPNTPFSGKRRIYGMATLLHHPNMSMRP